MKMKTIRISEAVWNEIAKRGKFGETSDEVLRRVFGLQGNMNGVVQTRSRRATRRMSARVETGRLFVSFINGPSEQWTLPDPQDKRGLRSVRDAARRFALENGATEGQLQAISKALTSNGYHLTK